MRSETNMFSHPTLEPTYSQEGQPALLVLKEWGYTNKRCSARVCNLLP